MSYPYYPLEAQYPLSIHVRYTVPSWTQTAARYPICPWGACHNSSLPGRGVVPLHPQEGRYLLSIPSRNTTSPSPGEASPLCPPERRFPPSLPLQACVPP